VRIDSREHANKITMSRLWICAGVDHGGGSHRPVAARLFRAGLAVGLGKPLFWTCEEGEARDKKLFVDTRQVVVTPWTRDKLDDFPRGGWRSASKRSWAGRRASVSPSPAEREQTRVITSGTLDGNRCKRVG
jgi:hypothetical protein